MLLPAGIALRGLFLIDKDGVVRHQVVNDLPLGRSVDEALRMVKALQYLREERRSLPGQLAGRQCDDQADPGWQQRVLWLRVLRLRSHHQSQRSERRQQVLLPRVRDFFRRCHGSKNTRTFGF